MGRLVKRQLEDDSGKKLLRQCGRRSPSGPMPASGTWRWWPGRGGDAPKAAAINGLTLLLDRRYDPGDKKRSHFCACHGEPDPNL